MVRFLIIFVTLAFAIIPSAEAAAREGPPPGGSQENKRVWERTMEEGGPVFRLNLAVDIPVLIVGGLTILAWPLADELEPPHCAPVCDSSNVNGFDSWSAGYHNENWATTSDIALAAAIGAGAVSLFASAGFKAGIMDTLLAVESVVLANAAVVALNVAVRRPRPYAYAEKAPEEMRTSGKAALSFPSGHVGLTFAATSSVFSLLYHRHPDSPWPWIFLGFGTVAGGTVAVGRVMAGRHFTSDVIAGALIGAAVGALVPALHDKNVKVMPTAAGDAAGLAVKGTF